MDASQTKILSYTLEWGPSFSPSTPEMRQIVDDVAAGLVAFCLEIVRMTQDRATAFVQATFAVRSSVSMLFFPDAWQRALKRAQEVQRFQSCMMAIMIK